MARETPTEIYPTTTAELSGALEDAEARKGREAIADAIVRFATVDTTDSLSMLQAINIGYKAARSGKSKYTHAGRRILQGINGYFDDIGVSSKALFPLLGPNPQQTVHNALATSTRHLSTDPESGQGERLENLSAFVSATANAWHTSSKDNHNVEVITFSAGFRRDSGLEADDLQATRIPFYEIIKLNYLPDAPGIFKIPEDLLEWARTQPKFGKLANPHTVKFGGVSLADIEKTVDPDTRLKQILHFMGNIPKGDHFWNRLVTFMFLAQPHEIIQPAEEGNPVFENPDFSIGLLTSRKLLSDKLLIPALTGTADQEFDKLFANAYSNVSLDTLDLMHSSILLSAIYGLDQIGALLGLSEAEARELFELNKIASTEFAQAQDMSRYILDDLAMTDLFRNHQREVMANLTGRFEDGLARWLVLKIFFDDSLKIEHRADLTKTVVDIFTEPGRLETSFVEKLNSQTEELDKINDQIWTDIGLSTDTAYLPHAGGDHLVIYSKNSLPEVMGFGSVIFGVNTNGSIEFYLSADTKGEDLLIVGKIDQSGEINLVNTNFEEQGYSGLEALIEYFVVATFHDLHIKHVADAKTESETQKGKRKKKPRKSESITQLPRKEVVVYDSKTAPRVTTSDEISEAAKAEGIKKGYTPRIVPPHKTKLRGWDRYKQIYDELTTPKDGVLPVGEERERILVRLRQARRKLARPSNKKADTVPRQFKLECVTDPEYPEADPVYGETWVSEFTSPELSEEEKASLLAHYRGVYRGGSALGLLEVFEKMADAAD